MVVGYPQEADSGIKAAFEAHYPNSTRKVRDGVWLVKSADATTKEVSDKLQISTGQNGNGVVVGVNGYFGRWDPDLWEWLQAPQVSGGG